MPSGPKKRRASKKRANNSSISYEVKTHTDPAFKEQDAALSSMDSSSSPTDNLDQNLKETENNVPKNDASVDSAGKFDEDGNVGFNETEPPTILEIVEDVFLQSVDEDVTNDEVPVIPQPVMMEREETFVDSAGKFDEDGNMGFNETEPIAILQIVEDVFLESVNEDVTNEEVPVIPQPVMMEREENLKIKEPENGETVEYLSKLEEDFKAYDEKLRSEIRLEKFKNAVMEELKATEKMREFLVKLLDDINSNEVK